MDIMRDNTTADPFKQHHRLPKLHKDILSISLDFGTFFQDFIKKPCIAREFTRFL